jgi:tetratricopeptide (TPR) repeat protein
LFERAGDDENLRRVLERRVSVAPDAAKHAEALERLGNFYLEQLGDSAAAAEAWRTGARVCHDLPNELQRAQRLFERVLDAFPQDQEAAERLVELYAAAGLWSKVPEVYAVCVRASGNEAERVGVLLALAPRAAQAGAADEFMALADEALWRLGPKSPGLGRKLIAAKAQVLAADDRRQRDAGQMFRNLVDSYAEQEDISAYERFIDETADEEERRASLRWLYQWRAAHAPDPFPILFEWAEVEEKRLAAVGGAISVYERIIQRQPGNKAALEALARLCLRDGRVDEALAALETLREHAAPSEQSKLDLRMARLVIDGLERPAEALRYVARALETGGINDEILELTRRALSDPDARTRAAELLERASAATERSEAIRIMGLLLDATEHVVEIKETRHRWCERLLELSADDDRAALAVALRAAVEFPESESFWVKAETLGHRVSELAAVGAAYHSALAQELDAALAERVGTRGADFFEQVLGEPSGAVAALQRVLALAPQARWALDRVKLTLTLQRRYEELVELYDRAISGAEGAIRAELLDEAVVVARDLANAPEVAMGYLEQLLRVRPGDARVESGLERLYERHGQTRQLIELLKSKLPRLDGWEHVKMCARLAALWIDLGDAEQALVLIEPMLDDVAQRVSACNLLEKILKLTGMPDADTTVRLRAAQSRAAVLLEQEYTRMGQHADVIRVIELELELLDDPAAKAARLRQVATLRLDALDDPVGAFEALCALVQLEPGVSAHRVQAIALAERLSLADRLADVLIRAAEEADPPRPALLVEAAKLYAAKLDDKERAAELYASAFGHAEHDRSSAREAGKALEQLLQGDGQAKERCSVLEGLASLAEDSSERRAFRSEAARVALEQLKDAERAVQNWRSLLEHEPEDLSALSGLIQALRAAGKSGELCDALEARARAATDPQAARADRVRVAHLHAEELKNPNAAAEVWKAIRQQYGADTQSFEALCQLYEKQEQWDNLVQLLYEEARAERQADRQRQLYLRLAKLHDTRTRDAIAAMHAYAQAGDWAQATSVAESIKNDARLGKPALRTLLKMSTEAWRSGGKPAQSGPAQAALWALWALAQNLGAEGAHERALELCLKGATLAFERKHQRELRREAAFIASDQLADQERAIDILRQLFAEDSADDVAAGAAERYAALLEANGMHVERAELWENRARHAALSRNSAQACELWLRASELWHSLLEDPERAIAAYIQAAELGSERALEALAQLYSARGETRAAAQALDRLFERASPDARADRALRAAQAYLELNERELARARLEQALTAGADAAVVRRHLCDIYRTEGAWDRLAEQLAAEAKDEWDPVRRAELFHEAARLYADRLEAPAQAVPLLEQAYEARPERTELGSELALLLTAIGRFDDAVHVLERRIEAYEGRRPRERALVHQELCRVLLAAGRDKDALSQLEIAAQIDPSRTDVLYELARLSLEQGRLAAAEQTYRALLLALRGPGVAENQGPTRAEVYLGLSEVARRQGNESAADDFVESAFEVALGDLPEGLGLERALRALGHDKLLVRAVESRLENATDPARAADALGELVELNDPKAAADAEFRAKVRGRAEALRTALAAEARPDARGWRSLYRVSQWLEQDRVAQGVLEHWIRALTSEGGDPEQMYELAQICFANAARHDDGANLLETALKLGPDVDRALAILSSAMKAGTSSEKTIRLFERSCRRPGSEQDRAQALAQIAALPTATAEDVRTAVEHALSVGAGELAQSVLAAALNNDENRFAPGERAFILARLSALVEQDGHTPEAASLCERAAAIEPDPEHAAALLRHAATLFSSIEEHEKAMVMFNRLLETNPDEPGLWQSVSEAHKQLGRQRDYIELIDHNATRVTSAELRQSLLLEQAKLLLSDVPDSDRALDVLKRIVEADPTGNEAADLLADLLERTGRVDDLVTALAARLEAAKAQRDQARGVALSLRLAGLLERSGRTAEALDAYREVLRADESNLVALRAVARVSEGSADSEAVAATLERLLTVEKGRAAAEVALRLATIRAEQWNDAAAERALLEGFSADPSHTGILTELSDRYVERGQWQRLVEVLERALAAKPHDREIALRLSEASSRIGQHDRALEILDSLQTGRRSDAGLAHQRFVLLSAARRREEALEALEQAARLDPRHIDQLALELERASVEIEAARIEPRMLGLVELVERAGQGVRARELLKRLAQGNPPPRAALERLAKLEQAAENWTEAMGAYRRLLSLDLGDELPDVALALADACEKAGRAADARADLERALETAPRSMKLRARLRSLYEKIGARDQLARMYLTEASEQGEGLAQIGAMVNAGAVMLESGNATQAMRVLERAHEQEPAHIEAAALLAKAYRKVGRREDGLAALHATVARHSKTRSKDVARLHRLIADLYLEGDDLAEALEALRLAFDLDKSNADAALLLGLVALDLDDYRVAQQALQAVAMARAASGDAAISAQNRAIAYYHLGRMAQLTGDGTRARLMAAKAVAEDPTSAEAKTLLEEVGAS